MSTLYLIDQGAKLKKTSERLVVEKDGKVLLEVPAFKVDRILIYGNITITTPVMLFLLENGIDTSFLSIYGRYRGRLLPKASKNIYLRVAQFEKNKDEEFKLNLAMQIIKGKIKNSRIILSKYASNHPEVDFSYPISELDKQLRSLERKEKVSTLLCVEGRASAVYFSVFPKMIRGDFGFVARSRRPPKDPVNSLLSFSYTLLTNEINSLLSAFGFDPYIGYLHGINYGRPSLALDLVEEFRHLGERFTLNLINNGVIKELDFEKKEQGFYLKENVRKTFFYHYEKRMLKRFYYWKLGRKVTYRELFKIQAQSLARVIQKGEVYEPFQAIG